MPEAKPWDNNVTELTPRKKEAPAIGMSIVMNIPGDRQITLQSFVAQEDPLAVQCLLLDRMTMLADRQKARYEIIDFQDILLSKIAHEKVLKSDRAKQEMEFKRRIDASNEKIASYKEAMEETNKEGYEKHVADGRRGPYAAKGATLQKINVCSAGIKQEEEFQKRNQTEWDIWVQSNDSSLKENESQIEQLKIRIQAAKETIGDVKPDEEQDGA